MKKLVLLAVLCAFVFSAATASAAELQVSGDFAVEAIFGQNAWNFQKDNDAQDSQIAQRLTASFAFVANENLKAVMQLRNATNQWGVGAGALGQGDQGITNNNVLQMRQMYVDFNWPGTSQNIVAGYKNVALPGVVGSGSMILNDEVGTVYATGPITENISYLAGFARLDNDDDLSYTTGNSEIDAYYAAAPMSFDGFAFTPFFMYANAGENYKVDLEDAYWVGTTFTMDMFDPFTIKADLSYGSTSADVEANETSGWLFATAMEYKGFDFMTPEVFFVYTSGDDSDADTDGGGSMASLSEDWAVGSFYFGGDRLLNGSIDSNATGFWTVGVTLNDIQSFTANMSHTFTVLYAQGTNDDDNIAVGGAGYAGYLTEGDSFFEVDFNTGYKVYDELTLSLDLGYINFDADSDWKTAGIDTESDAWKVSTGLNYSF